MKKMLSPLLIITILLVAATGVWASTTTKTPAEIFADLTGQTVEEAYEQRAEEGKSFGQLASEVDKLEEFTAEMLENKKGLIQKRVDEGLLTQEEADEFIAAIEERIANCDGTGYGNRLGQGYGARFGNRSGCGFGSGGGRGNGFSRGAGRGFGRGLRTE